MDEAETEPQSVLLNQQINFCLNWQDLAVSQVSQKKQ